MSPSSDGDRPAERRVTAARTASRMQMGAPSERSEDFGTVLRRFLHLLGSERLMLSLVGLFAVAAVICNVLGPRFLGHATDVIIRGVTDGHLDVATLHHLLLQAVALYASSSALGVLSAYVLAGVVQRMMQRLRAQAEDKINTLPLSYVDHHARGDLLSRVTNDIDNIAQSLQQTMSHMLTSVLMLLGVTVMMFVISPFLAVVALVVV
ncbi:MAG TPA: ABC transporter transmembrane domain-containing protein, partial [Candidatus Limnocylindrales bacterium]